MSIYDGKAAAFRCVDGAHYLEVEPFDSEVWCSFYVSYSGKPLRNRLKGAWDVLRGREVFVEEFVFDGDTAIRAGEAMQEAGGRFIR